MPILMSGYGLLDTGWVPQGQRKPITADGIELFHLKAVPVTRYRYRGSTIPSPWDLNRA